MVKIQLDMWSRELVRITSIGKYKHLHDQLNFSFHTYDNKIAVALFYKEDAIISILNITENMTLIDDVCDMIFIPLLERLSSKWGYDTWD